MLVESNRVDDGTLSSRLLPDQWNEYMYQTCYAFRHYLFLHIFEPQCGSYRIRNILEYKPGAHPTRGTSSTEHLPSIFIPVYLLRGKRFFYPLKEDWLDKQRGGSWLTKILNRSTLSDTTDRGLAALNDLLERGRKKDDYSKEGPVKARSDPPDIG